MFDDIRPYNDAEVADAIRRIVADNCFPLVAQYLYPGRSLSEVTDSVLSCRTAEEFQLRILYPAVRSVIQRTTEELSVSGMEQLDPDKAYLFVSNHRDIVLDAAILQVALLESGYKTAEVSFGANLMQEQLVIDVGKSCKMFRVERPTTVTSARDFLRKSQRLSEYIRYTICEKKESIWIAQRNGRTKDGLDLTEQGVINMFEMSGGENLAESLARLHIVPVAISYEWEPCDRLKALEMLVRRSGQPYVKKAGEDLESILTGLRQPKGRVQLSICAPLEMAELEPMNSFSVPAFNQAVVSMIDRRIHGAYRLWPNNLIAAEMVSGKPCAECTEAQRAAFAAHIDRMAAGQAPQVREILLQIYANPVLQAL